MKVSLYITLCACVIGLVLSNGQSNTTALNTTVTNTTTVPTEAGSNVTVSTTSTLSGNTTASRNTSLWREVIDSVIFSSTGVDGTDVAADLLNSYHYMQYFRTKNNKGISALNDAIAKSFKALVVKPRVANSSTLKPTQQSSFESLSKGLDRLDIIGFDEIEYRFFKKESARDYGGSVRVRYDLTETGRWNYTRQPVDELGYLWSEGGGVSMVCMERGWYNSKADSILRTKTGGNKVPEDCKKFQNIQVQALNYQNLFTSRDAGHNLRVINYHTTQYGFAFKNCEVVVESAGCVMRTAKLPNWINFGFHNETFQYPVAHILINENLDNSGCMIRMCAVVSKATSTISDVKLKGVEFSLGPSRTYNSRRLLDVTEKAEKGYKSRNVCNTKNQLLPYQKSLLHSVHRSVPGKKVSYCNGTSHTTLPLNELYGCYSVAVVNTHHQCPGLKRPRGDNMVSIENVNCTIDYHVKECGDGHYCFKVSMLGSGAVTVKSNHHHEIVNCKHECLLSLPDTKEDTVVTCPDGKSHKLLYNLLVHDCPFERYLGHNAFFICRMSSHPKLVYALFFWLFGGCPLLYVVFTLWKYSIICTAFIIIKVRRTVNKDKGVCEHCGDFVPTGPEWQRHESCKHGSCPYCKSRFSISGLKNHICLCLDRDKVRSSDEDVMNRRLVCYPVLLAGKIASKAQKHTVKFTWFFVLLLLLLLATRPVQSLQNVVMQEGLWEDEVKEVELCKSDCSIEKDLCTCEDGPEGVKSPGRKLLFEHPVAPGFYTKNRTNTKRTAEVIYNVKAPWGVVDVKSTHRPAYSSSSLEMSWSSEDELDDGTVVLSGRSSSILKLEPNTGITWTIKSKQSKEERRVSVSIIDHSQIYNARFQFLTGDRTVGSWMHGTCTEECPEKCGCTLTSCHHLEWIKSRNWHCNPLWCWAMDQGCTCCAIDIQHVYNDWVLTKWSLDYIGTEALVCVDYDSTERECDVVNTATQFEFGPYTFQVSDVGNVQHKLPSEILIFHKVPADKDTLDLMKHYHITSADNICKLQSCTHGSAGDSQVYDLDRLISNDIDSEHFFKNMSGKERSHWMSWEGVTMDYHCNQGHWPDCVYTGVVEQNSEAFANLLKVEQDYVKTFFFHNVQCRLNGTVPALELQARSKVGPGSVNVFLEVKGLTLTSNKAHLTGLSHRIVTCGGCYGCIEGGKCTIVVIMTGVPKLGLHFESQTEHVTVEQSTELVSENEPTSIEIRFFSVAPVSKLCIKLKEYSLCKTCDKSKQTTCVPVQLKDPERVLLEHRGTLVSTTKDNCTSFWSCWTGGLTGFGLGLGNLLSYLGGSLLRGILIYVAPILLIVLLILYGPSIIRLILKFRRLRGVARRARIRYNAENGIIKMRESLLENKEEAEHDLMNYLTKNK